MDEAEYQAKVRHHAVPASYLILESSVYGGVLLAKRHNTGYMDGHWELPAGHVDPDEMPSEAMIREAKEELGIVIKPRNLAFVHASYRSAHDKTGDRIDFVFQARMWFGEPKILEPEKCAELRWFQTHNLPENMVPQVREFISSWRKGIPFSELDIDWLKANGQHKV
jgi:8-oxo-dGTP diphosphatase